MARFLLPAGLPCLVKTRVIHHDSLETSPKIPFFREVFPYLSVLQVSPLGISYAVNGGPYVTKYYQHVTKYYQHVMSHVWCLLLNSDSESKVRVTHFLLMHLNTMRNPKGSTLGQSRAPTAFLSMPI